MGFQSTCLTEEPCPPEPLPWHGGGVCGTVQTELDFRPLVSIYTKFSVKMATESSSLTSEKHKLRNSRRVAPVSVRQGHIFCMPGGCWRNRCLWRNRIEVMIIICKDRKLTEGSSGASWRHSGVWSVKNYVLGLKKNNVQENMIVRKTLG